MEETRANRPARLNLEEVFDGHRNEWVALGKDMKVVASGETFRQAAANAEAKGCEFPVVIWAPPTLKGYEL